MRERLFSTILMMAPVLASGAQAPHAPGASSPVQPTSESKMPTSVGEAPNAADPAALADGKPPFEVKDHGALVVDDATYVVGPQDVLSVVVWGEQEFNRDYLVRPDGKISMPIIADILAAGRTPADVSKDIADRLKKMIKEPIVGVMLAASHSRKFYILGEVNRPGAFDLVVPTRVLEALVNAGGFRDFANQKDILINRGNGKEIRHFNFRDVSLGKHAEQNIHLEPGDVIIVK